MYRLSLIISEIYNKYLPLAEKDGIILNLDFSDTTKEIADPERVKQYLDEHLDSTLKRSDKGEVTIGVDKTAITITDSATTLSHTACALLSNRYIDVTSRVGFGTTVKIFFQPRELTPATPKPELKVEGVAVSAELSQTSHQEPILDSEVKLATKRGRQKLGLGARLRLKGKKQQSTSANSAAKTLKSQHKPALKSTATKTTKTHTATSKHTQAKTDRQLAAAARKADKEVKRIAKKASKQAKKSNKTIAKTSKTSKATSKVNKTTAKTNKKSKKLEIS